MKNKISLYDFTFVFAGYGHYKVTYKSPVTGKTWTATTSNMRLIDATRNADNPTQVKLNDLKYFCKNN